MWHVESEAAIGLLELPNFEAKVDIASPSAGLSDLKWNGHPIDARLLQVSVGGGNGEAVRDCYVRMDDLIIAYEPSMRFGLRPQVYWRAIVESKPGLRGVELILSMQTDSLDIDPRTDVRSRVDADQVYCVSRSGDLTEIRDRSFALDLATYRPIVVFNGSYGSYLEMAFPTDVGRLTVDRLGSGFQTIWSLFSDRLEKGVIRRGRVRGVFTIDNLSAADIVAVLDEFLARPVPLTT